MCGKCAAVGHGSDACEAGDLKCCHCGEPHAAWNNKCKENLFQSEVAQTMHTRKLQRFDASHLVMHRYHNRISSYAPWPMRAGFLAATIEATSIAQHPTHARTLPPTPANHQITHSENEMEHETREYWKWKSRKILTVLSHLRSRVRPDCLGRSGFQFFFFSIKNTFFPVFNYKFKNKKSSSLPRLPNGTFPLCRDKLYWCL